MGNHVLTLEYMGTLLALISPGALLVFALWKSINGVAKSLDNFKIEVAKGYASMEHLQKVEERLVTAINRLDQSMKDLPRQMAEILTANGSRRRLK
jgi:hypothetical protein